MYSAKFITRVAAVAFLVAEGKPLNCAKVAVDESFNYDGHQGTAECPDNEVGLCAINNSGDEDIKYEPVTKEQVLQAYNDMCGEKGYFTKHSDGFYFDGEDLPKYDLNGDITPQFK
jgi:hypothetical protein